MSGPEVVVELLSLQEEVSPRLTEVAELPFETLIDLPTKLTMELPTSLAGMRALVFLRSPEVYDPLQIFLKELVLQKIDTLICWLDVSGAELICHASCILLELSSMATCLSRKPAPPSPPWSRCDALVMLPRLPPWPD